jgi:hypothetical protein
MRIGRRRLTRRTATVEEIAMALTLYPWTPEFAERGGFCQTCDDFRITVSLTNTKEAAAAARFPPFESFFGFGKKNRVFELVVDWSAVEKIIDKFCEAGHPEALALRDLTTDQIENDAAVQEVKRALEEVRGTWRAEFAKYALEKARAQAYAEVRFPGLTKQVENDAAVMAAQRAFEEARGQTAVMAAMSALDEARAKAVAEARNPRLMDLVERDADVQAAKCAKQAAQRALQEARAKAYEAGKYLALLDDAFMSQMSALEAQSAKPVTPAKKAPP